MSDSRYEIIAKILNDQRKRKYELRAIINAILWIQRTGIQWRNLDKKYPPWRSVYYYFRRWKSDGTLERLNSELNKIERKRQGKEETPSLLCIDSQSVKSVQFINKDKGIDGNKLINGRKRHLIVDTLGLIWGVVVHAADIHDGVKAHLLVEHCLGYLERMKKILVDDAYKKVFYDWVSENIIGLEIEFASKPPTEKGFVPIKWRWVNERTFGWFNFFRRHSKDYEKTVESAEAWILWTNCQIILNRLE
ncbi:MAG: IS5 family transposase [Runella sp.]